MEEVIEKRKWLWRKKSSAGSGGGGGKAGEGRLRRRPTLSHFLAECERYRRRHSSLMSPFGGGHQDSPASDPALDDVNFRLQQRYWGKVHRRTPTPRTSPEEESGETSSEEEDSLGDGEEEWEEEEDENELMGMHRRSKSLRRKERPLSTGALPDVVGFEILKKFFDFFQNVRYFSFLGHFAQ